LLTFWKPTQHGHSLHCSLFVFFNINEAVEEGEELEKKMGQYSKQVVNNKSWKVADIF